MQGIVVALFCTLSIAFGKKCPDLGFNPNIQPRCMYPVISYFDLDDGTQCTGGWICIVPVGKKCPDLGFNPNIQPRCMYPVISYFDLDDGTQCTGGWICIVPGMCNGLHNATNAGCPEPVVPESCKGKPLISYRPYYYKEKSEEKCYQPCPDKKICE